MADRVGIRGGGALLLSAMMLRPMEIVGRAELRSTFDAVADAYQRTRPAYPVSVFDGLAKLAQLRPGSRVVEVGCGTGQATVPLAERGYVVTAVELGRELAVAARARLARYPFVEVVHAAFEEWQPERADVDAVVSFAAFHWIDPEVRYAKAAHLLRRNGSLAVFDWHDTLAKDGDDFFIHVERDYAAVVPEWRTSAPPRPDEVADPTAAEMAASGYFTNVRERRYAWSVTYNADDYVTFLNTRSSYRLLDDARRGELFDRVRRRIEARPSQAVEKEFLGVLVVGSRRGE